MINKLNSFPFLLLLLFGCQTDVSNQQNASANQIESTPAESEFILVPGKKIGKISAEKCSPQDVLTAYAPDVAIDSIDLGEGLKVEGLILYPDDLQKRVEFFWDYEIDSLRPSFIKISGDEQGGTRWKTAEGITIGTPIEEVQRLNGKPFLIYGFEWDYGGMVKSWNEGKLSETLGLVFTPSVSEVPEYLMGDSEFSSDDESLLSVRPLVSAIVSSFRE